MLALAALAAGIVIGFFLAVVAVSTQFEHPSSLERFPGAGAKGLEPHTHSRFRSASTA
jgi:hypothetical protein